MIFRLVFTGSIPPLLSNPSEVQNLFKQCVLSTQQERSFKRIEPSEWWWREEWWTSRESLWLPAIGTWGYPIRDVRERWVWCFLSARHPGLIPVYRKNSCTLYSQAYEALRQLEYCQLCSQKEWRVDGWMCCQITTLADQYKTPTTPNFRNRKTLRF